MNIIKCTGGKRVCVSEFITISILEAAVLSVLRLMIADGMKCMNRAKGIYGEDNEFVNYTDLGDYPSDNLERPGFKRMMTDVVADNLDVIVVITLDKITTDIDLLLETYKTIRKHNIELITANDGKKAMEILDKALIKWGKN